MFTSHYCRSTYDMSTKMCVSRSKVLMMLKNNPCICEYCKIN